MSRQKEQELQDLHSEMHARSEAFKRQIVTDFRSCLNRRIWSGGVRLGKLSQSLSTARVSIRHSSSTTSTDRYQSLKKY